jgi:hypothetical protein
MLVYQRVNLLAMMDTSLEESKKMDRHQARFWPAMGQG